MSDQEIIELVRKYISDNSDNITRPDMNAESHLLAVIKAVLNNIEDQTK